MDIKIFSKSQIKHYRPQTETVLISVQDVCDAHKSRNFVSHSLVRAILDEAYTQYKKEVSHGHI